MFERVGAVYVAAASFVGFESFALILSYVTMSPVAVPALILGIGLFALTRTFVVDLLSSRRTGLVRPALARPLRRAA